MYQQQLHRNRIRNNSQYHGEISGVTFVRPLNIMNNNLYQIFLNLFMTLKSWFVVEFNLE